VGRLLAFGTGIGVGVKSGSIFAFLQASRYIFSVPRGHGQQTFESIRVSLGDLLPPKVVYVSFQTRYFSANPARCHQYGSGELSASELAFM